MNKPVRTATAGLYMSYGHFVITDWSGPSPAPGLAASNGLVGADFSGAVVLTGIANGWVNVAVQLLDTAPGLVETDDWDEVAEVSVDSEDGELVVHGRGEDPPPGLPELAHAGPGSYRLRVHARGRDIAAHHNAEEPVETYRISAWPAPEAPEAVYKQSDKHGQEIRAQWPRP
ncbi:hypothetical protein [Amycolatopsis sp. GA6-003]|uniref:hypothetical protein n=1 Tax=Amycolatopsis sp. GA6-003 TaxID=2652444 RepID=UPI003917355A